MRTSAVAKFLVGLSLAGFLAGIGAPGLRAQWYGRNKVQYQKFDFKIMKTRHFDVYFYLAGRADGQDGLPHGRALVFAPVADVQSRAQGPPAAHPLRQQPRVPADDGHPRDHGRGHGRRHGVVQAPHRPALRRLARRDRPRHRARARPRLPVRHHGPGALRPGPGQRRGPAHPALVHRGHGRVPVHRPGRPQHVHVDAGRRPPQGAAPDQEAGQLLQVLPLPLGPGRLVLHHRPLGRRDHRQDDEVRRARRRLRDHPREHARHQAETALRRLAQVHAGRLWPAPREDADVRKDRQAPVPGHAGQPLQYRAVHQPRRQVPRLPFHPGPVLDRPLPGRRRYRQDPAEDHLHGRRPPLREHPVHQIRRVVGRQGGEVRLRRRGQGPARS